MEPMTTLAQPSDLSDEAAAQMLDLLHELATAFEKHYATQLRRHYQPDPPDDLDLLDPIDEHDPPF